jgi:hypothetical protein
MLKALLLALFATTSAIKVKQSNTGPYYGFRRGDDFDCVRSINCDYSKEYQKTEIFKGNATILRMAATYKEYAGCPNQVTQTLVDHFKHYEQHTGISVNQTLNDTSMYSILDMLTQGLCINHDDKEPAKADWTCAKSFVCDKSPSKIVKLVKEGLPADWGISI